MTTKRTTTYSEGTKIWTEVYDENKFFKQYIPLSFPGLTITDVKKVKVTNIGPSAKAISSIDFF